MLADLDLTAIQDEKARLLIQQLLNLIEQLAADLREAQAENQRLRMDKASVHPRFTPS